MSYQETVAAARRLSILLALYFASGYTLNRHALRDQVERTGYVCSSDLFDSEIAWLVEMGLVERIELDAIFITVRGVDVALGKSQTPGIRRPSPGETKHGT
jgi:hypothetical protein